MDNDYLTSLLVKLLTNLLKKIIGSKPKVLILGTEFLAWNSSPDVGQRPRGVTPNRKSRTLLHTPAISYLTLYSVLFFYQKVRQILLESVHFSGEIFLPNISALLLLSSVLKGQKCWGEISRR